MQNKKVIIQDRNKILEYLDGKTESIVKLINENKNCDYILFQKYISHSDVLSAGKRLGKEQSVEKNYLYYLSNSKMEEMEKKQVMESAKQSNIGMPKEFYKFLEIPMLKRREGQQTTQHEHPLINNYADVYLVNDTLKYFTINYTKKIFEKLGKEVNWNYEEYNYSLNDTDFTPVQISYAIHGLGTESDILFHKIRRNIFKTDSFMCLIKIDLETHRKKLYIILEKNPIFFTILGESNETWEKYIKLKNLKDLQKLTTQDKLFTENKEKNRNLQSKWKDMLAAEMMNYTSAENEVFCPMTYITANYINLKTLFRASHIKAFSECDENEAYDINNGLLLCANADALFDKHLITIDENKELILSFTLKHDEKLIQMLRLNNEIFKTVLNEERMKYLEFHRNEFIKKETLRQLGTLEDEINLY